MAIKNTSSYEIKVNFECKQHEAEFSKEVDDKRTECGTIQLSSTGTEVFLCCCVCGCEYNNLDDFLKHTFQSHINQHDEHNLAASYDEAQSNDMVDKCVEEEVKEDFIGEGEEILVDFKVEILQTEAGYSIIKEENVILYKLNFDDESDQEDSMDDYCWATHEKKSKTNKYANSQQSQAASTDVITAGTGTKRRTTTDQKHMPSPSNKSFTCEKCGKCFPKVQYLRRHIRRHGVGLHICEFCGTRFVDSSNYRVHCYRHLGIKPYPCKLCDMRFTNSTELTLHNRTHNGERPYACEECGQRFRTRSFLKYHGRRHRNERPHVCAICGKTFYERQLLADHEISHSKERPYSCFTCGMTFSRFKTLKQHEKLHSDTKMYLCTKCPKVFAQLPGLISHMKSHKVKERKNRKE